MPEQTEINSVHLANGDNIGESYNIIQMPLPIGYFDSRQVLVFLLCESCFMCSYTQL